MPRTPPDLSQGILIELDTPNRSHVIAGDIVTGLVTFKPKKPSLRPINRVKLTLFGRTKTKITRKNANDMSATHRGRRVFFEIHQDLSPGDGAENSRTPASCTEYGDSFKPESGYWSTEVGADKFEFSFPSTYYHFAKSTFMSHATTEAYVEYALKVELSSLGSSQVFAGATPLAFRARSTELPITRYAFKSQQSLVCIKSANLTPPPYEQPVLSKRESLVSIFRPTPTPRYIFSLKVEIPTTIQLDHPEGIPIRIEVIPDVTSGYTNIAPDNFADVNTTSVSFSLQQTTCIRSPTTFGYTDSKKKHTFYLASNRRVKSMIPCRQVASSDQSVPEPLDLRDILKLRVSRSRAEAQGCRTADFEHPLVPTFSTYNIQVRYQVNWRIVYECCGENESITGEGPIVIIAPSEATVRDKESTWMGTERGKDIGDMP